MNISVALNCSNLASSYDLLKEACVPYNHIILKCKKTEYEWIIEEAKKWTDQVI